MKLLKNARMMKRLTGLMILLLLVLGIVNYLQRATILDGFYNQPTPLSPKIDKIYYINMDRRPDRNKHVLNEFEKHNIDMTKVSRFKGIDGLVYTFSDEERNMFKNANFLNTEPEPKIMGNQLSHFNILKKMIDQNYQNIIIFQDDSVLINDFVKEINNVVENLPEDAEIVNFGFHKEAFFSKFVGIDLNDVRETKNRCKRKINDYICEIEDDNNPCSLAYIVTLKGAKNIVKHFNETGFLQETDHNYNHYLISKNINYASSKILCTGNPQFGSDIFK